MKTLLLKDRTVGKYDGPSEPEDIVTVHLHDENGNPIEVTGEVVEILEDD